MAHLTHCEYCNGHVLDASWHPECRIAHLENLLAEIKKDIERDGRLSTDIQTMVKAENWVTWEAFHRKSLEIEQLRQPGSSRFGA